MYCSRTIDEDIILEKHTNKQKISCLLPLPYKYLFKDLISLKINKLHTFADSFCCHIMSLRFCFNKLLLHSVAAVYHRQ